MSLPRRDWIEFIKAHRVSIFLGCILLGAAFFRLWQLNSLPPGLHPDEAANGLDIIQRIFHGDIRPLYNTNGPRESLFFFLQAPFVLLMGKTILALRLAPALIGIASVYLTYKLMQTWFSERAALAAAFFMATGSWAVTISRDGFRANLVPLVLVLTCWLVTLAIKKANLRWWLAAGGVYGLGFYTYIAWQITPLLLMLLIVYALVRYRKAALAYLKPLAAFGLAALIVLTPLGLYAAGHPGDVFGGRSSVSFTNADLNHGNALKTLATTLGKTALMFNFRGDPNYRQNLGGAPMLNALVGVLFILGILLCLIRIRDPRYLIILVIFGGMLLPEILTAEGIPHGLRAIGAMPMAYILAAIGLSELIARWQGIFPLNPIAKPLLAVVLVLVLAFSVFYDYERYFVAWANDPATFEAYSEDAVAIANYMLDHPFGGRRYVVIDGYSDKVPEYFTAGKLTYQRIEASALASADLSGNTEVIVVESQQAVAQPILSEPNLGFRATVVDSTRRIHTALFILYQR